MMVMVMLFYVLGLGLVRTHDDDDDINNDDDIQQQ